MIIGGGLVGCETALMLVRQGKKVVVVEALDEILSLAGPLCYANREMLADLLRFHRVEIRTGTKAVRVDGKTLTVTKNGIEEKIATDSVIIAVGYDANTSLYDALLYDIEEIYQVGDARKVSNIMYAIWDAFEVARNI